MKFKTNCSHCGKEVIKKMKTKTGRYYCDINCKSEWQRNQKPVDKEWLYKKYVVEELSANDIAKIVKRNPKRVWEWLRDYGIKTRPRGTGWENKPDFSFWKHGKSSPFKGKKHTDAFKEEQRKRRLKDGRVPYLTKEGTHYMRGRKGALHHGYKGGSTPERQSVYSSINWRDAVKKVWKRDDAICQKCGLDNRDVNREETKFHIHHMYSFTTCKHLQTNPDNLILLCENCHRWVHSNENKNGEFIPIKEMRLPEWILK